MRWHTLTCSLMALATGLVAAGAHAETTPRPYQVRGDININPNNSPQMQFEMEIPEDADFGKHVTRHDLLDPHHWHNRSEGTLYEGPVTQIVIRPKGNSDERDLERRLEGGSWQVFSLEKKTTYKLIADGEPMRVRVYNTHKNPKGPMGHWYLEFTSQAEDVYFGDKPGDDDAEDVGLNLIVYGVNRDNGMLSRYDMRSNYVAPRAEEIGSVTEASKGTLTNIQAGAYIPGLQNMFAFWQNPDTNTTRLTYINLENARAAFVGQALGAGRVTGAAMAKTGEGPAGWDCFAVQELAGENIDFEIEGDTVITKEKVAARVEVLGAAITAGGQYDVPVTMDLVSDNKTHEPFGRFDSVSEGNVNDGGNPRYSVLSKTIPAGAAINVSARSWLRDDRDWYRHNGDWHYRWNWDPYLTSTSDNDSANLLVLRDGESVPDIDPFMNQGSVASFVDKYVNSDTGKVELQRNQAIYLFELGTTDTDSSAADFQDLVVMVTLARERDTLKESSKDNTVARLMKVNTKNGKRTPIMPLSHQYDSLATTDGQTFYATKGAEVWKLDGSAKTEGKLGALTGTNMTGLAFGGTKLLSFEAASDELLPIEQSVRQEMGTWDIRMQNLGTMVFGEPTSDPKVEPDAYD